MASVINGVVCTGIGHDFIGGATITVVIPGELSRSELRFCLAPYLTFDKATLDHMWRAGSIAKVAIELDDAMIVVGVKEAP